jgi:hypothetical protein
MDRSELSELIGALLVLSDTSAGQASGRACREAVSTIESLQAENARLRAQASASAPLITAAEVAALEEALRYYEAEDFPSQAQTLRNLLERNKA